MGTQQKYQRQVTRFAEFLGHDEPSRVTVADAQRYLEHLKSTDAKGRNASPKQVQDVMNNIATVYQRAVDVGVLKDNSIRPVVPAKHRASKATLRGPHTEENAKAILKAARGQRDAFRRWGPFLKHVTTKPSD